MIICFKEKYGNRFVEGDSLESICSYVLKERIEDTFDDGLSVWYDDQTPQAKLALEHGKAFAFMRSRSDNLYKYEGFYIITTEKIT